MQRQKSILSFFQKPSPESSGSVAGNELGKWRVPAKQVKQNGVALNQAANDTVMDSSLEIRGTDTPPEKVPRQIFPAMSTGSEDGRGSSLFSSIMHKFVKVDDRKKATERY